VCWFNEERQEEIKMRIAMLLIAWTLVVLYPNMTDLVVSARHAWSPPVDPRAVQHLLATLPDDPRAIELAVNTTIVPYAVPWETYNVPWYFPTPREVLERGEGDCQARAVVLASILRAKGIPARFVGSFDHLWIDYPGKQATAGENPAVALVQQQANGSYTLRWPALVDWKASWEIERAYFWDAMPGSRLTLLGLGWIGILNARRLPARRDLARGPRRQAMRARARPIAVE
jgi:hypothetical protein